MVSKEMKFLGLVLLSLAIANLIYYLQKGQAEYDLKSQQLSKTNKLTVTRELSLWELAKARRYCKAKNFKGVDVNIVNKEGKTPLMLAAQHNNSRFIDCMREGKADVHMKDSQGKTAFDYIKKAQSRKEQIFSMRTYHALRSLEVYQIIGDKAHIMQEHINVRKKYHKVWIEGAKCEEFVMPKGIECTRS